MNKSGGYFFKLNSRGITLVEVIVAAGVFLLFVVGVYGAINMVFKIVYQSRLKIVETSVLAEQVATVRNMVYDEIGIVNGVQTGEIPRTQNVTRNNMPFTITATVRNFVDNYDGTIGGNPNDLSPADYKLVEFSIICDSCRQQTPVILSTIIGPRNLEGASDNGALFIQVFDKNGLAVVGANVHVVNNSVNPVIDLTETTDNDGWLKLVDVPTSTMGYQITASKEGYSSDYTLSPSPEVPTPVKLPANVASQMVTEIYFSIDRLGSLNLHTMGPSCVPIGGVGLNLHGTEKLLGIEPNVYKLDEDFTTDGGGDYSFPTIEWDKYYLSPLLTTYDVAGSIPMLPVNIEPGQNQEMSVILRPHTTNSLLVKVKDAGTSLPLSSATIRLYDGTYDQTETTDLGYTRQTDWSVGSGQDEYITLDKYFSDDSGVDNDSPVGSLTLKRTGGDYVPSGILESSTFDLGGSVDFRNIIFEPLSQPVETGASSIRFQIATTNSSTPASWDYIGPDGTAGTYYNLVDTVINPIHDGNRYLRYKVFLSTANQDYTSILSELAFTFTNACLPPGQAFFNSLSATVYNIEVSRSGYAPYTGIIEVSGQSDVMID